MIFKKKKASLTYDKAAKKPIIHAGICTGEQVAGFKDLRTGAFEDICVIKSSRDLDEFKRMYGIETDLEKEY